MTTIAIVGSRFFTNEAKVRAFVQSLPIDWDFVSGGAIGPDSWSEAEARARGMALTIYYPQYEVYGKNLAPKMRNKLIVADCDLLVGFWDGSSGGTLDAAKLAVTARKPIWLVTPEDAAPTLEELQAKLQLSDSPS